MNKVNMTKFIKNVRMSVSKHSPEILTGIGITGMITTTVLAVRATPKALKLLEMENERRKGENEAQEVEPLTKIDVVKVAWKPYIPAAVTGVMSVACLIGASSVNARRNAALATAYKLSETALTEYREKVIETIGENKEREVREAVDKERVHQKPVQKNDVIITGKGNTLCFEHLSGRYFRSDIERIRKAENTLNKRMLHDIFGHVSLNEFYDEIGLERTELGDTVGWKVDKGMIDIDFSSQITEDGEPCLVIEYLVAPHYGYSKTM